MFSDYLQSEAGSGAMFSDYLQSEAGSNHDPQQTSLYRKKFRPQFDQMWSNWGRKIRPICTCIIRPVCTLHRFGRMVAFDQISVPYRFDQFAMVSTSIKCGRKCIRRIIFSTKWYCTRILGQIFGHLWFLNKNLFHLQGPEAEVH